jgi:hypothetical protein
MVIVVLVALIFWPGHAAAEGSAEWTINLMAIGGDNMVISPSLHRSVDTYGSMILKEYEASVKGGMVNEVDLRTSSSLTESIDGETRFIRGELHQRLLLPGYFNIDMSNEDNLYYMRPFISPPELQTRLNVYSTEGQWILNADAAPEYDDIDQVVYDALDGIDQQWYETYSKGNEEMSGSKRLELTIGYGTSFSESSGGVKCDWGHSCSATKSIEFK